MERNRDPLLAAPLPFHCRYGGSHQAREEGRLKDEMLGRAGATLKTVQEMASGKLTNALQTEFLWGPPGDRAGASRAENEITDRMVAAHVRRPLDRERDTGERALGNLVGESSLRRGDSPSKPGVDSTTRVERNMRPLRGERWPIDNVNNVDLPGIGTKPVDMMRVSSTASRFLSRPRRMLDPDGRRKQRESGIISYHDENLRDKPTMLALAARMWMGSMLREVDAVEEFVSLFAVVKKVLEGESELTWEVVLRLIFDHRYGNLAWKVPPWIPLSGPSCFSEVNTTRVAEAGKTMDAASGDIPSWFYLLQLPEWCSAHFVLQDVSTSDLLEVLKAANWKGPMPNPKRGQHLGLRVVPMGWRWAVYLAQVTLIDVIMSTDGVPGRDRILCHGSPVGPLDPAKEGCQLYVWGYVDDFGIKGWVDGVDVENEAVRTTYRKIRARVIECGFPVHKESWGIPHPALGTRVLNRDQDGEFRSGCNPKRRGTLVEGTLDLLRRKKVLVDWVWTVTGCWGWAMLPRRPTMAVFRRVYVFIYENDRYTMVALPDDVKNELWAAVHLSVLMEVNNSARFAREIFMMDASPEGGALVSADAELWELEEEGIWSGRSGFYTLREEDFLDAAWADQTNENGVITAGVFRVLILGDRGSGEDSFVMAMNQVGQEVGENIECVHFELGGELGLCSDHVRARISAEVEEGLYHGCIMTPGVKTWSRSHWDGVLKRGPGGTAPYRSRERPWGLGGLRGDRRKVCQTESVILLFCLRMGAMFQELQRCWTLILPEDVGEDPYPSPWVVKEWDALLRTSGVSMSSCDLCCFGTSSRKPVTLGGRLTDLQGFNQRCQCESHPVRIKGRDLSGAFVSELMPRFSFGFCKRVSLSVWETMLQDRLDGDPDLDGDLIDQIVEGTRMERPDVAPKAGARLRAPQVHSRWLVVERWRERYRFRWEHGSEGSNILETRTVLSSVRHIGRSKKYWGLRVVMVSDNLCSVGCISKGRSNSWPLAMICLQISGYLLGYELYLLMRWIESRRNYADGPSRGRRLGYLEESTGRVLGNPETGQVLETRRPSTAL